MCSMDMELENSFDVDGSFNEKMGIMLWQPIIILIGPSFNGCPIHPNSISVTVRQYFDNKWSSMYGLELLRIVMTTCYQPMTASQD